MICNLNGQPVMFVNFDETLPVFKNWAASERRLLSNPALARWFKGVGCIAVESKLGPPVIMVIDPIRGNPGKSVKDKMAWYDSMAEKLFSSKAVRDAARPAAQHLIESPDKGIVGLQGENVILVNSQLACAQLSNMGGQYIMPLLAHEITHALELSRFTDCIWYRVESFFGRSGQKIPEELCRKMFLKGSGIEALDGLSAETKKFILHCIETQEKNASGEEHFTSLIEALSAFVLGICPAEEKLPDVAQAIAILEKKVMAVLDWADGNVSGRKGK